MPTLLGLIKQEGPGQDMVCFCVAACLASLVLDEAAMEAVVQRKDSPVMFENALALLEKTIDSLDTNAVEVRWTAALVLRCSWGRGMEGAKVGRADRHYYKTFEVGRTAVGMAARPNMCICRNAVTQLRSADQGHELAGSIQIWAVCPARSSFWVVLVSTRQCRALHRVLLPDVPA